MKSIRNKKKFFYLKSIITAIILWSLAHHSQLKLGLFSTLFYNPFSTFLILVLCYLMVILHAWRWYRLNFVQGITLSFTQTITPTYIGIAFNNVLPGSIGGDFFRLYFVMKKFPEKRSIALLSLFVDRMVGFIGIFVLACATTPYYLEILGHDNALFNLFMICISFFLAGIAACFFACLLISKRLGFATWLTTKFAHTRFSEPLASLIAALHVYKNSKLVILESIAVSMFTQVLLVIVVLMISHMMGLPSLSPFDYMLALVIGQVANLIPLTPGGIGVGETAFANIILMINPGTSAPYATIFFAVRLLSSLVYLPGVFLGIFGFNILRGSTQDLEMQAKTEH